MYEVVCICRGQIDIEKPTEFGNFFSRSFWFFDVGDFRFRLESFLVVIIFISIVEISFNVFLILNGFSNFFLKQWSLCVVLND